MSSTRSRESAFKSSWNDASIVTCSGSQPRRSTMMFLKSSKLSFCVSKSCLQVRIARGGSDLLYQPHEIGNGGRGGHGPRGPPRCELLHHPGQRALQPHLDEDVTALVDQALHASRPANWRSKLHLHDVRNAVAALVWPPGQVGH